MADSANATTATTLIKNGTMLVQTGGFVTNSGIVARDTYVLNTPVLSDFSNKYTNRFDYPSYYYGTGSGISGGGA
jgi:hypothetical protein